MSKSSTELSIPALAKRYRQELGLTQTEFANNFGYETPTAVSLWESGYRKVPNIVLEDVIPWLIQSEKKQLIDLVEDRVLKDVELRGDKTDAIEDIDEWLQGGGIPPSYDYLRIRVLVNARHLVQRKALTEIKGDI